MKYKKRINKNRKEGKSLNLFFYKRHVKYKKGNNKNRNTCSSLKK